MIISIEGIDGAGKNTLVTALQRRLDARVIAFPRYEASLHAQLAQKALRGQMGDLVDSAYGMATLFALDRHGAKPELQPFVASRDVVILDRYVASNAAYTAARLNDAAAVDWVSELEFGTLALPKPDLQVWLATDVATASARATGRAAADATRALDAYERDGGLQARTFEAYRRLADSSWISPWLVVDHTATVDQTVDRVAAAVG